MWDMKWENLPFFLPGEDERRKRYINDTLLVLGSILLITGIIFFFRLAGRIADSLLLYLLIILALACVRGLYAALLASVLAFFAFYFLFIPPAFSFEATKFEDVLGLVVFLVTAIITGQLASSLRQRAIQSSQRERETHILYDFMRAANRETDLESQLAIFVSALVKVFSAWGIRDCMLLLPDALGTLKALPSTYHWLENVHMLTDEQLMADWVLQHGSTVDLYDRSMRLPPADGEHRREHVDKESSVRCFVRLVPIKTENKGLAVLRLLVEEHALQNSANYGLEVDSASPTPQVVFFSTFLEQAVMLIEQGRLRKESLVLKAFQQTEALRTALLSSVSHDLRTPLATIKASATGILEEELQYPHEGIHSFASAIEREVDRLDNLVENILEMSRLEAGILRPEKMWYPLGELIHDVLNRVQPLMQGRSVETNIPVDLPPILLDSVQIDQVMTNLIENAIRHTPAGSPVEVTARVNEAQMVVSVADRGPGIPTFERQRIFDKFYRIEGSLGHTNGLGLGLAICRGVIEAHGGAIWVQARENGGAEFCFTLPLQED
jgi:two-component system, OmpR family, sensor histidine kinase KdpD